LKSESKGESKDIKVRNENKLVTFSTDAEAKVTAKADEVKAIKKTQTEFRMEIGKQLDKRIGSDLPVTLPPFSNIYSWKSQGLRDALFITKDSLISG
jgi:hypothetical protein